MIQSRSKMIILCSIFIVMAIIVFFAVTAEQERAETASALFIGSARPAITAQEKDALDLKHTLERMTDMIESSLPVETAKIEAQTDENGVFHVSAWLTLKQNETLTSKQEETVRKFIVNSLSELDDENLNITALQK